MSNSTAPASRLGLSGATDGIWLRTVSTKEINFVGPVPPPLEDGDYQVAVEQTVSWGTTETEPFSSHYAFSILGPRFTLDPSLIHSSFPPPSHTGHFDRYLPQMVFSRRGLPWERTLDGGAPPIGGPYIPWLALLSFTTDAPKPKTVTVGEVINNTDKTVYRPVLQQEHGDDLSSQCTVIDVDLATYQALIPSEADLEFLASARFVSVTNKEITETTEDGWFSVILGNRFPDKGGSTQVYLVSLEGFKDHLHGGSGSFGAATKVRLVVLTGWKFTTFDDQQSFRQLMDNVTVDRLQLTPKAPVESAEAVTPEETVAAAFNMGFTGVNHTTREGEKTVSWYRGPLQPMDNALAKGDSYATSDAALRYDPGTGMFDVSYAAAWEIGRLLALHDPRFAAAINECRSRNVQSLHATLARNNWQQSLKGRFPVPADPRDLRKRGAAKSFAMEFWRTELGPRLVPDDPEEPPLLGQPADPTGLRRRGVALPEHLRPENLGQELTIEHLVDWILGGSDNG